MHFFNFGSGGMHFGYLYTVGIHFTNWPHIIGPTAMRTSLFQLLLVPHYELYTDIESRHHETLQDIGRPISACV